MKEEIALFLLLFTCSAVVIIETIKTGRPPAWFESSALPMVGAALLSLKIGVEKTVTSKDKDKDADK